VSTDVRLAEPRQTVQIVLPDGRVFDGPIGTPLEAFIEAEVPYLAALVDGTLRELTFPLLRDAQVEPIDLRQSDGIRIYHRSLTFLLVVAVHNLVPGAELYVDHSLPFGGYFCELRNRDPFSEAELEALSREMKRLVDADLPIVREQVPLETALELFEQRGESDKVAVFQGRDRKHKSYLQLYSLDGYQDYLHGYMVPSTGYLRYYRILPWEDGFILQFPRREDPAQLRPPSRDPKLLTVFRDYGHWLRLLGVDNVGGLNRAIDEGNLRKIILVSEALHEHRIAAVANAVWQRRDRVRVVLIAGPSSSGKTTFSKRLAVQLLAHGIRPFALELDNYFVNREETPRDEKGDYDFEALEALDVPLFNAHLAALMSGVEVRLPKYNFRTGQREEGQVACLSPDQVIIVEGIHGLNPRLVYQLPEDKLYRVYVSALTQLNLDRHNRISTTDTRLIRRITRDARTRGYNAAETLQRWESVRRGEKRYIFPYQENADSMFNSALVFELSVLRPMVEPLLLQVERGSHPWVEAKRLLSFLQWFRPVDAALVPENSLLREFLGGLSLEDFHWDGS